MRLAHVASKKSRQPISMMLITQVLSITTIADGLPADKKTPPRQ
jgi:hypothetical protein